MCPRIWPIEDICMGLYVLKRLLTVWHILEKVMSMQHSFEEFSEKQRRVELKSVGNFVAKTVLVESANQFSLEAQNSMKYFFRSHIDHQTYGKTLLVNNEFLQKKKMKSAKIFQNAPLASFFRKISRGGTRKPPPPPPLTHPHRRIAPRLVFNPL